MKDPKAIRKAIMTAKSIASLIDPKFARVPLPDIGLPAPDFVVPDHSTTVHSAYDVPMPQKYAAGGDVDDNRASFLEGNHPLVPHVVYHGTDRDISEFEPNQPRRIDVGMGDTTDTGWYSKGHYFTPSPEAASNFASNYQLSGEHGPNVMPVHLSLKNPFIVKVPRHSSGATEMDNALNKAGASQSLDERLIRKGNGERLPSEQTKILRDMGHDGVIVMQQLGHKDEDTARMFEERARMAERLHQEAASEYYDAFGDHDNPDRLESAKDAFIKTRRAAAQAREEAGGEYRPTEFVVFEPRQIKSAIGNRGTFDPSNPNIGYAAGGDVEGRDLNKFGLYSHAAEQAGDLARQDSPENYRDMLLKRGVKPAELEWSGFNDAFANQPQITRDQVVEHFQKNMPDLYETQYGGPELDEYKNTLKENLNAYYTDRDRAQQAGEPFDEDGSRWFEMGDQHDELREKAKNVPQTFHEYHTVPGGKNYREILVQHNSFGGFEGVPGHFGGAPDIIASLRLKDREDHEGDKVLHLEELQSDWGQQGRRKGFRPNDSKSVIDQYNDYKGSLRDLALSRVSQRFKDAGQPPEEAEDALEHIRRTNDPERLAFYAGGKEEIERHNSLRDQAENAKNGINPAAYVTKTDDWVDLGLKRALLEAAKGGYDKLAWSPGDVHADRYDLSKHIGEIRHEKNEDGTYNLDVYGKDGNRIFDQDDMSKDDLANHVGKEMAEKIVAGHGDKDEDPGYRDWRTISGLDLKVGGEGMRKFYDEMLPKRLTKLVKQHDPDAKLEVSHTKGDEWPYPISIGGDEGDYHLYGHDARGEGSTRGILARGFKTYGEADDARQRFLDGYHTSLPAIKITPRMRESILKKGFAAYADGGEVEGYAIGGVPDIDVERYRQHLKRIYSPLSEDPEIVKKALQVSRSYHSPIGMETGTGSLYNIKQSVPAKDVNPSIEDIPGISMKKPVKKSWEAFYQKGKGGVFINMGGDLSNFGRLTHINGKKLAWPVDLHAGTKFMLEPNPKYVWGNAAGHSTAFENKIRSAEEAGKDVYGIFSPMGPSAVNSSHNMFDALMAQIPDAGIDKKHMREFDAAIKRGDHLDASIKSNPKKLKAHLDALKAWPGLENAKEASEFARPEAGNLTGTHRTMLVKFMDKADWLKKGFPEVGVTRSAITDPELKGVGGNKIGHRVVKLSSETLPGAERAFEHSTYPTYTSGEYVMDVPLVQRHYAAPDVIEQMVMKPTKAGQVVHPYSEDPLGRATARKLFEEQKQMQPINPRFLDSVMMGMENQEKYGFKAGGSVRRALMIAKGAKKK